MKRTAVCNRDRLNVLRILARLFVVGGGLFWIVAAFAAQFGFRGQDILSSAGSAALPFGITVVVFLVGLYHELLASALLGGGVLAIVAWGVLFAWEPSVWILMSVFFISPMAMAGLLYYLADRMQRICENPDAIGAFGPARGYSGAT